MLSPSLSGALAAAAVGGMVGATAIVSVAHAATEIPVTGLPGFGQVVVDKAANRVFVSEGTNASNSNSTPPQGIVVTDLSGNYLTTIDQGTGAEGLTLAPDGMLYAALSTAGKVAQIDPAAYSETDYPCRAAMPRSTSRRRAPRCGSATTRVPAMPASAISLRGPRPHLRRTVR